MNGWNYIEKIKELQESHNLLQKEIGDCCALLFCSSEKCPSEDILDEDYIEKIDTRVYQYFPTKFASKYKQWRELCGNFFLSLTSSDSITISKDFTASFKKLIDLWEIILYFLPFLLMQALNRMDRKLIEDVAKSELSRALKSYITLYHKRGPKLFSHQRELITSLLDVFRKLDVQADLQKDCIFFDLLKESQDFSHLFPRRFDALLEFINCIGNTIVGHEIHVGYTFSQESSTHVAEKPRETPGSWNEQRLGQQMSELQSQWDLLNQKVSKLEREKILETDPEELFRLDHRIADLTAERNRVEQQLNDLETRLGSGSRNGRDDSPELKDNEDRIIYEVVPPLEIPHVLLGDVHDFLEWAFLDIITILTPLFEQFCLVYVSHIETEPISIVKGISLSGIGGEPDIVQFYLQSRPQSESEKIVAKNLYFIKRDKQIKRVRLRSGKLEIRYLVPTDYLDLTPLMIYAQLGDNQPILPSMQDIQGQKELFVLKRYDERKQFLVFLEFTGTAISKISRDDNKQYWWVLDEYQKFCEYFIKIEKRLEALETSMTKPQVPEVDLILNKTWQISLHHLSTLLDIHEYNKDFALLTSRIEERLRQTQRERTKKFQELLFEPPKEQELLSDFFRSDKRGVFVVGKAGSGKSNVLCHLFLQQRRAHEIAVFIDARNLGDADIRGLLKTEVVGRVVEDWDLQQFDQYLQNIGKQLLFFIDAVNEHSQPLPLLQNICSLVEDTNIFANLKVIASCRSETWNQYKEETGREEQVLDERVFLTINGDALILSKFEEEERRERLYTRYQAYYHLKPVSYKSLSQPVKRLLKHPFMMALIAEIYKNEGRQEAVEQISEIRARKIPRQLDYFILFRLLTERKIEDAKRLLQIADPLGRETFDERFMSCLFQFAKQIYHKVTSSSPVPSIDTTDTLTVNVLENDPEFRQFFLPVSVKSPISVFETIIQVGILERIFITETDYWGKSRERIGYKFFHDEYTQYWLSALYNQEVLGQVTSATLQTDPEQLEGTSLQIKRLLDQARHTLVLAGALDHWLFTNMTGGEGKIQDVLLVLLNRLAEEESGFVKYYLGHFVHSLVEKNLVVPSKLYKELFTGCSTALKQCIANHLLDLWPEVSPENFRSLLEACDDEKDDIIIRTLADICSDLFSLEPGFMLQYLDRTLHGIEGRLALAKGAILSQKNFVKHIAFIFKFIVKVIITDFTNLEKMALLRNFLQKKFKLILDTLTDKGEFTDKALYRKLLYRKLEESGIDQWDQSIRRDSGKSFFIEDDGMVQRDLLYNYYEYVVAFHNREWETLSLDRRSGFREMSMKMITYRDASIIGYIATVIFAGVLSQHQDKISEIVEELMIINTEATRDFENRLLASLALMNPDLCPMVLDMFYEKIVPFMLHYYLKEHLEISQFIFVIDPIITITGTNVDKYWGKCENILTYIIDTIGKTKNQAIIAELGDVLIVSCFYPDIRFGTNTIRYLLSQKLHLDPLWRPFTLKVLAGMLARNPVILNRILDQANVGRNILNDARPLLIKDIFDFKERYSYMCNWNRLINSVAFTLTKLRYFLVKVMLAGLVQSNSVPEAAREFRRFVIETVKGFLGEEQDSSRYDKIDIHEALSETEAKRQIGGGKLWIPKNGQFSSK